MFDRLLTALIKDGRQHLLFQVKDEWLEGAELAQMLFVRDYLIKFGDLPPFDVINRRFQLNLPTAGGRFLYELKQLKERYVYLTVSKELPAIMSTLKTDPLGTMDKVRALAANLEQDDKHKDTFYHEGADVRILDYRLKIGNNGVVYLSTGFPELDDNMYGWQKADLITMGGRSGLGKTWFCCILALALEAILPAHLGPILFSSNEIQEQEIKGRMDCLRFKLGYERFQQGKLTRPELIRYQRGLKQLEADKSRIIIVDNVYTLEEWQGRLKLYRPAMAFIDGSYMWEPHMEEDWKKIKYITSNLKRISKQEEIPHFNTTQLKRSSGTRRSKSNFDAQDDFAWGSSYTQDSDIAWTGYQTPQMQYSGHIGWQYAKGRRVKPGSEIIWKLDLETMQHTVQVMRPGEPGASGVNFDDEVAPVF